MATSTSFSFERLIHNLGSNIERPVRNHLAKVYCCLTATTVAAALGALVHLAQIWEGGFLSALISLGLVLGIHFSQDNGKNFYMRLGMLLGFGFFTGHSMGLLLENVMYINPQIIVTALAGSSVVFVSLSLAALFAKRGQFMFLGGFLFSILSTLALIGLGNLLFRSYIIHEIQLYVGLFAMSAFILYDTQMIMEKYRMGHRDCVAHSLDLFFDFASVFRRLLIILTQKEQRNEKKRKNN